MEIKVLESSGNRFKFELIGEDHTLCNIIRKELWEDKNVEISGYDIAHPLVSNPVITVETNGKETPKKALSSAIDRLEKKNKELLSKASGL